jgi:hypothetical protein
MDTAPITLPNRAANLDLLGTGGQGLTLAQAEAINCNGTDEGDAFADGNRVIAFGENQEVWLEYTPELTATALTLFVGYIGTLDFQDAAGSHHYQLTIGSQLTRDGAPLTLGGEWSTSDASFVAQADELTRALLATFAPDQPADPPGTTCVQSQKCAIGALGSTGYLFVPQLGFAFWVADITSQPGRSIPNRIDVFLTPSS